MDKRNEGKNGGWKFAAMERNRLGLDDRFRFACDTCGGCCREQEDLLLNPYDIFRMAKHLEITPDEWIDLYGRCHIGSDSRVPIIRIKLIGEAKRCPFLKDGRCSLHQIKPDVCAMYPLGRAVCFPQSKNGTGPETNPEVVYFHSGCQCGSQESEISVREWLDTFGLRDREDIFVNWSLAVSGVSLLLRELEKQITDGDLMRAVWNMVIVLLYARYDTGKEFLPQFKKNLQELKRQLANIKSLGGAVS